MKNGENRMGCRKDFQKGKNFMGDWDLSLECTKKKIIEK